ncbi:hypothetical protein BDAG_04764 [Burkholderia dolosa AU0158]|nr:hypothetical protein BDAG_04764 [Burkholderia dolosa AU0158]
MLVAGGNDGSYLSSAELYSYRHENVGDHRQHELAS